MRVTKRMLADAARTFSEVELETMRRAALEAFDDVAYDVFTDGMGEDAMTASRGRTRTLPRSHVIELALDAGRFTEKLRTWRKRSAERFPEITDDLLARIDAASYETLTAAVFPAFPFTRYGL